MFKNLRAEMFAKKVTCLKIAAVINSTPRSVQNKLHGKSDFKSEEMFAIQKALFPDKSLEYLFAVDDLI